MTAGQASGRLEGFEYWGAEFLLEQRPGRIRSRVSAGGAVEVSVGHHAGGAFCADRDSTPAGTALERDDL